jgi:uncharacterized protein (DUF1501 family)
VKIFALPFGQKQAHVVADWPGLKSAQLYGNRELTPTTYLRAALKGVLGDHASVARLGETIFPESARIAPLKGLTVA